MAKDNFTTEQLKADLCKVNVCACLFVDGNHNVIAGLEISLAKTTSPAIVAYELARRTLGLNVSFIMLEVYRSPYHSSDELWELVRVIAEELKRELVSKHDIGIQATFILDNNRPYISAGARLSDRIEANQFDSQR